MIQLGEQDQINVKLRINRFLRLNSFNLKDKELFSYICLQKLG
jgi:hypothetical protein